MAAPQGNKLWQTRSSHGRKPIFESPEILWAACEEYFEWVVANPIKSHKQYCHQGVLINGVLAHQRPMSVAALCIFLGIAENTWANYGSRDDDDDEGFLRVTRRARSVISTQKLEGATCGIYNANIVARDLGLKDASTHEHSGEVASTITSITETIVYPAGHES